MGIKEFFVGISIALALVFLMASLWLNVFTELAIF